MCGRYSIASICRTIAKSLSLGVRDVSTAGSRVDLMEHLHIETPLLESLHLSAVNGGKVWLKLEALQPTGSFKLRGIGYACTKASRSGARELVSSSGGNAGLAVAYSGRQLGLPVTVVVPASISESTLKLLRMEGANVEVFGEHWREAHEHALSRSDRTHVYIHPFDDPDIWLGHSTLIDEVASSGIQPDAVVLSVGGGGLLCGVVNGMHKHGWCDVPVLAVETVGAASLNACAIANKHVTLDKISSIATSLGATRVCDAAFDLLQSHPVFTHTVSDRDAVRGCCRFLNDHRIVVEPACGAAISAVYDSAAALFDRNCILLIVCGGVASTADQLKKWQRDL